jgi:transposase
VAVDWRAKVELFEEIRREYEFGAGTILGVAKKLGVHRRMVREALGNAVPSRRKKPERKRPKLAPVMPFIDAILAADRSAPRKQRHTAHRIYQRVCSELASCKVAESSIRRYVREKKAALGLAGRKVCVPQSYAWGSEGQVDWYEAYADLGGERQKLQVFSLRSMASGAAFHRAYRRATQQAFLEAHEIAFRYFGGVFHRLRFDNLTAAVKKILRGYQREETARFIAFRSHWGFAAEFCTPAEAHEKGGVEGEAGYFRRNHWVPVPQARDLEELNRQLLGACEQDQGRTIAGREQSIGMALRAEQPHLLPLAREGFDLAELSFPKVDGSGCVRVRTNFYSAPLPVDTRVQAKVYADRVEIWHEGAAVARHERCYDRQKQVLDLEHYLEVLEQKPGALAGSTPLKQWRERGRWPDEYDRYWEVLMRRQGKQAGTRQMVELLGLGKKLGYDRLQQAMSLALANGCGDVAAVRYLLTAEASPPPRLESFELGELARYERPLPGVQDYDQLLSREVGA